MHGLCNSSFLTIDIGGRFRLAVLLALVKHGAVALILAPFAAENFNKRLLFVKARVLLEDRIVLELAQTHILSALLPSAKPSLRFIVVRDVAADVALAFEQIEDAVLVLLQLVNVHVVEVAATNAPSLAANLAVDACPRV